MLHSPIGEDFYMAETYYTVFFPQVRRMARGYAELKAVRQERGTVRTPAHPYLGDARDLLLPEGSTDLMVPSPLFVKSYKCVAPH
jgi:hypothetical protein